MAQMERQGCKYNEKDQTQEQKTKKRNRWFEKTGQVIRREDEDEDEMRPGPCWELRRNY
jgi:hypothetical protein